MRYLKFERYSVVVVVVERHQSLEVSQHVALHIFVHNDANYLSLSSSQAGEDKGRY